MTEVSQFHFTLLLTHWYLNISDLQFWISTVFLIQNNIKHVIFLCPNYSIKFSV